MNAMLSWKGGQMARITCPTASGRLTIDLNALRENYAAVSRRIAPAKCGAVVKANAYGLGAMPVVDALRRAGCTHFFMAHLAEALELAPVLDPTCQVFILNGLDPDCEPLCADHGFLPVLNSLAQVERWRALAIARRRRLPAALQVDSGMSRLGLTPAQATALSDTSLRDAIELRLIMTHLACADDVGRIENREQLKRFEEIARLFPDVATS
ncbi:MAG: alanine racemase, partial [Hyphomicrobiales bacterium]